MNRTKKMNFQFWRGTPVITPEPRTGKFQKWVKMKVNYPTDKKNTPDDFSNNFRNLKKIRLS
jgi:hypothetical protein